MSPEILQKLLPKISKLGYSPTDVSDITAEDVMHALGTVKHDGASLLLRVKYLEQWAYRDDLFISLYKKIAFGISEEQQWAKSPYFRPHLVWDMCKLAIEEHCAPGLCTTCNGRKEHRAEALIVVCQSCKGSGKQAKNDQQWTLKFTDKAWKEWAPRYKAILVELDKCEAIGMGGIAKRLSESA